MSEPTVDQRLALADEASRLLESGLFNLVVSSIVKKYMQDLMKTRPGSDEGLVAHAGLNALEDIKAQLTVLKNDGVVLRNKLEKEAKRHG